MSDYLDSIWIIDKYGLCLIHRVFDSEINYIDETMFSGFMTALLNSMSDAIDEDESLEMISLGNFDIYFQIFTDFMIVVSTKKGKGTKIKDLSTKLVQIGKVFGEEYLPLLKSGIIINTDEFRSFGLIINDVFGIESLEITKDHILFLELLREAEQKEMSEFETIENILNFIEDLDSAAKISILKTTWNILNMFMQSKNLTTEHNKRFQKLLKI